MTTKEFNEVVDSVVKIFSLADKGKTTTIDAKGVSSEASSMLTVAISELRRKHDYVSTSYNQLRAKVLAVLASLIAGASFLYTGASFYPSEPYGKVLFFGGSIGLGMALLILVWLITPVLWHSPVDTSEILKLKKLKAYSSLLEFQDYIVRDYAKGTSENVKILAKRSYLFNISVYIIVVSVILIVVIKYGKVAPND